jgi:hypothetical protein
VSRLLPPLTALVLVIVSGLMHRLWARPAIDPTVFQTARARLDRLPRTVGDWAGEPIEFDGRGLDRAGIAGLLTRRYQNRRTGEAVAILLVYGRPGPIAVHGPEICYAGAGYQQMGPIFKRTLGGGDFWMGHFRKDGPVEAPPLRIYWAWNAGDRWQAPARPRLEYADTLLLYKLYIIFESLSTDDRAGADSCRAFAAGLLDELRFIVPPGP